MQIKFTINNINKNPFILAETDDFAVVYKPPRMHSVPLKSGTPLQDGTPLQNGTPLQDGTDSLVDWYAAQFTPAAKLSGKRKGESGLLHRLDFETHGLVLFAKNQQSFDFLLKQQEQGNFIKEYSAICQKSAAILVSFPHSLLPFPPPESSAIESFFRPFGPGRKQVRPVTDNNGKGRKAALIAKDHGAHYRTEIVNVINNNITPNGQYALTLRLRRGFRHQIRCHLAWIGCPVANDPVYGEQPADGFLALRSHALFFPDPASGQQREYSIVSLSSP